MNRSRQVTIGFSPNVNLSFPSPPGKPGRNVMRHAMARVVDGVHYRPACITDRRALPTGVR